MRRNWLFFVMLACASSSALAVTVPDFYAAKVAVKNESATVRASALKQALSEVMVRVSGRARLMQLSGAESVLDQASALVQRYSYQDSKKSPLKLYAEFEGNALEQAMLEAGLPVWGPSRPVTMVWLLVNGELVTRAGPDHVVAALQAAARKYGVPLRFPRAEAVTNDNIRPADIRKGHIPRIMMVTRSYDTRHVLLGVVSGDAANWRLIVDGKVLRTWRAHADKATVLVADAVGESAQIYSQRYAVVGTRNGTVVVGVQGIHGSQTFTRVRDYLIKMTAVDAVTPILVTGKTVVFRVAGPDDAKAFEHRVGAVAWLDGSQSARRLALPYAGTHTALGYSISR